MKKYLSGHFIKLAVPLFLLACQSAHTQTDEIPRVTDQNEITLKPQAPEPEQKSEKVDSKKEAKKEDPLAATVKKYGSGSSITIELVKTAKLKMLNRTDEYKGNAFIKGKDKLRLEFSEPAKSVAVLNGKRAWVIEYPSKDVDDKIRISKFSLSGGSGQSQLLVTSIISSGNLLKTFKVKKRSDIDGKSTYDLTPKKNFEEIKSLSMVIDDKSQEIKEIKYLDPIDNETTFTFLKTKIGVEIESSLFEYVVPKGAEVNEF